MGTYLVFTRDKMLDEKEFAVYSEEAKATVAGHPLKVLAFYGAHEDLEGPTTDGTVIFEFPNRQAAMAWYNSPAYRKAREHRFKAAIYRVTLVEGI